MEEKSRDAKDRRGTKGPRIPMNVLKQGNVLFRKWGLGIREEKRMVTTLEKTLLLRSIPRDRKPFQGKSKKPSKKKKIKAEPREGRLKN